MRLKRSVELNFMICADVPINFLTDHQRLRQILLNLMRNSIKFTYAGTISLKVRVVELITRLRERNRSDEWVQKEEIKRPAVQFEVYDTGIGINNE